MPFGIVFTVTNSSYLRIDYAHSQSFRDRTTNLTYIYLTHLTPALVYTKY